MPRNRMCSKDFWSDEEVGRWCPKTRLFYMGLWSVSDDGGRFKANSDLLKSQIFPYDNPKTIKIEVYKKTLGDKIVWYEVNGQQYGYLRNFLKHQKINRPTPSKIPPPPQAKLSESSVSTHGDITPKLSKANISKDKLREVSPTEVVEQHLSKISKEPIREYVDEKPQKKEANRPTPEVLELMEYFYSAYEKEIKDAYFAKNFKNDRKIFEDLIKAGMPANEVKINIDRFFVSEDKFIRNSSYTTGLFKSVILILKKGRKESAMEESDRIRQERVAKREQAMLLKEENK